MAQQIDVAEGDKVEFFVHGGRLIIRPVRRRYRLSELVKKITEANRHEDLIGGNRGARRSGEAPLKLHSKSGRGQPQSKTLRVPPERNERGAPGIGKAVTLN